MVKGRSSHSQRWSDFAMSTSVTRSRWLVVGGQSTDAHTWLPGRSPPSRPVGCCLPLEVRSCADDKSLPFFRDGQGRTAFVPLLQETPPGGTCLSCHRSLAGRGLTSAGCREDVSAG
ncbi:hypothetical protein NDU88_008360 [Pleurodeles waltl]|uniref:Uncharacterized protein n=1 Tax=Pleurodeles waltl TaxID=8319 RepID=A0AAV7NVU5_PLEWA|nr:hypothetical protein NDU88_008360 [Pleurodeles waltl]